MANCGHHRLLRPHCSHLLLLRPPLLPLCLALVAVAAVAADGPAAPTAARPDCPARCGAVDIPYPFGIGERCAINSDFAVDCNKIVDGGGTSSMTPFINHTYPVTRISVADNKVWVKWWISKRCYPYKTADGQSMPNDYWFVDLTGTPYWISDVDNKFFVIGCNSSAYMSGVYEIIGCYTTCEDDMPVTDGECSGAGCCNADVLKNLQYYQTNFDDNNNSTDPNRPCGYSLMMESAAFNFSTTYLTSTVLNDTYRGMAPMVLDWHIGDQSCDAAMKNRSSYACVSKNSECTNSTHPPGYLCKCSNGYKGNPYIKGVGVDGCTDIDECLNRTTCTGKCKNTVGSYICSCPPGKQMVQDHCVNSSWVIPVAVCVVFVALLGLITFAYLIKERRKLQDIKQKYFRQHGGMLLFEEMKSQQGVAFKIYSEEELQEATDKFDERHIIGYGGHGTVYKGLLKEGGIEVAIKRCRTIDEQQKKEFGREMMILSQINHRNIVKLLGCCLEVEVPTLVYEFVPNGTLFQLIHSSPDRRISLGARLQIAHDSAESLAYLHSWASPPILHGDVKSSNILLDGDYIAKVSDFGASILAPSDKSQFVTLVQGTCGYLDPEYMQTCQLTDKSDVYSFGVVLLELLTGRMAFNLEAPEHEKSLSMMFLAALKGRRLEEILDDQVRDSEDSMEVVEEVAELAKQCLEMCGEDRPSMKDVADKLGRLRKVLQHPWAEQGPEEMENLLGEPFYVDNSVGGTTGNFSIEKNTVKGLESGR